MPAPGLAAAESPQRGINDRDDAPAVGAKALAHGALTACYDRSSVPTSAGPDVRLPRPASCVRNTPLVLEVGLERARSWRGPARSRTSCASPPFFSGA